MAYGRGLNSVIGARAKPKVPYQRILPKKFPKEGATQFSGVAGPAVMMHTQADTDRENAERARRKAAFERAIYCPIGGGVIGGAATGLLWKSHRVAGSLLGLVGGSLLGFGVAYLINAEKGIETMALLHEG